IGAAAPFVSLGPEVAFEVSCSVDEEIFSLDQFGRIVGKETRGGMECGDDTASVQVGLRAGGGVEFPVSGSIRLVLRAHYLVGLTDALDGSERGNAKLQSIGVSAGIAF
ncbi:MAG: hypothetical protein KJO11_01290, partial [Gemmatimonadetes bacterium]|nr:hypothetical protein [Gemmatimonadota bacterium]